MKRILFLSLALSFYGSVNAQSIQLFTQDFSSSTVVTDYASALNPTSGMFNAMTTTAAVTPPTTVTIENGALRFNRTGTGSIFAYRNYAFSVKPTFVQFKMDFEASANVIGTQTPIFNVFIGSAFSSASTGTTSAYASRFGILAQATAGDFKISTVDNIGGAPQSAVFSGKQTITFVVNNSGGDQTYTAPDASTETVANAKMDVWIGTTRGINDFSLKNTTSPLGDISGFKIQATSSSGTGVYDFDNIEFTDLLGTSTLSTSKFGNSVADIKVYPNPTEGVFEIKNLPLSLETINLGLYSLDSKLLESNNYNVNNGTVKLDISGLAKGVYFVKGDSDSPLVAKVIKK